jgi:hypothetical protein
MPANLFVAPFVARPLVSARMFRPRVSPFAALAGLLIVFSSCERHHVGELPELQREHLNPLAPDTEDTKAIEPPPPSVSPTPVIFFPHQKP